MDGDGMVNAAARSSGQLCGGKTDVCLPRWLNRKCKSSGKAACVSGAGVCQWAASCQIPNAAETDSLSPQLLSGLQSGKSCMNGSDCKFSRNQILQLTSINMWMALHDITFQQKSHKHLSTLQN